MNELLWEEVRTLSAEHQELQDAIAVLARAKRVYESERERR